MNIVVKQKTAYEVTLLF